MVQGEGCHQEHNKNKVKVFGRALKRPLGFTGQRGNAEVLFLANVFILLSFGVARMFSLYKSSFVKLIFPFKGWSIYT
jgi:hypothetical protein